MQFGRRRFLRAGGTAASMVLLPVVAGVPRRAHAADFGPLVADPNGLIDLPEGFTYTIVQDGTGMMSDGFQVPGLPDGMACFDGGDGTWVLMRNAEVGVLDVLNAPYAIGGAPPEAFDADAFGGVTRVVIDPATLTVMSSNLVLAGTIRNCAGGPSPWGWLSCEESADNLGHGYVFLCDHTATTVQPAQQIVGYGRFNHEAAGVDPSNHRAYLTEDRGDSSFYRFVPDDPCEPFVGKLQALRVVDEPTVDTGGWEDGRIATIDWVDIDTPDPQDDTVRVEAQGKGAAIFHRGEGVWFADGACWFSTTAGGPIDRGQIWRLTDGVDGGMLELVAQSHDDADLDSPDNIVVSPWGQLFMCEDGAGENLVRMLQEDGTTTPFARNTESEFAGGCFSPDGRVFFVNIQGAGLTLAISGPFPEMRPGETPPPDCEGTSESSGGVDDTGGASSDGGEASDGSGNATTDAATTGDDGATTESGDTVNHTGEGDDGCGCASEPDASTPALLVAAAGALLLHPRR